AILLTKGYNSLAVLPIVIISGALAGIATGLVHTRLKIDALLAGILVMTALYSINLTMLGRSNVPLLAVANIFQQVAMFGNSNINELVIAGVLLIIVVAILVYVLHTDFGIAMRATGDSSTMTTALGINNNTMKTIGFAIGNALTATSGFLVAQYQAFTDINMGIGIVITGLGAVLIGDALQQLFKLRSITSQIIMVIVGSVVFQLVLAFTLSIGIDPNLLKLVTASTVLGIVAITRLRKQSS
ncbi:MAG TPA: ABC transporter permease, partial [Chitinophagaceae bacterium]|nr:ABC transporter permease [Chitinophagaceae bacterium]